MAGASTGMTRLGTAVKLFTGETIAATTATGLLNAGIAALGGPLGIAILAGGALTAGLVAYSLTQKKSTTEADKFAQSCKKLKKEQDEVADSIRSMKKENENNVSEVRTQGVQADNLLSKLKSLISIQKKDAGTKQQINCSAIK